MTQDEVLAAQAGRPAATETTQPSETTQPTEAAQPAAATETPPPAAEAETAQPTAEAETERDPEAEPAAEVKEEAEAASQEVLAEVSEMLEELVADGDNAVDDETMQEALRTPEFEDLVRQAAAELSEELAGVQASGEGEEP
jgi:hypothetical protein